MRVRRPRRRTLARSTAATTGALLVSALLTVSPAQADDPVAGAPCTPGSPNFYIIESAEVNPVLTHFYAFNVAPGTTGQRTYTLTRVNTVTTTINNSIELDASAGNMFIKVGIKIGFSVQQSSSTTDTESTTMTWTINDPGYYGLYKGTRSVAGTFRYLSCVRNFGSPTNYSWVYNRTGAQLYTTYGHVEEGTITCGDQVPPDTLREQARLQLGC